MTEQEWLDCTDPGPMLEFLRGKTSDRKLRLLACGCAHRLFHLLPDGPLKEGVEVAERYADGGCSSEEYRQAAARAALDLTALSKLGIRAALAITDWDYGGWEPTDAIWGGEDDDVHDLDFEKMVDELRRSEVGAAFSSGFPQDDLAMSDAGTVAFLASFRDLRQYPGAGIFMFARSAAAFAALPTVAEGAWVPCNPSDPVEGAAQAVLIRDSFGNPFRSITIDPAWITPTVKQIAETIYQELTFDRLLILANTLEDAGCTYQDILNHCRQPGVHVRGCWALDLLLGKE